MSTREITYAAAGAESYWFNRTYDATIELYGYALAASSGYAYVSGYAYDTASPYDEALLLKYNSDGVLQWQVELGDIGYEYFQGVAVDSSGNVFAAGYTDSDGAGSNDILIAKYDSTGAVSWQRTLGTAGNDKNQLGCIAVDGASNSYISGEYSTYFVVAKYDSSGSIQWQRTLDTVAGPFAEAIAVDSSSNVYLAGTVDIANVGYGTLAKYDSSGTIQWQKKLSDATNDVSFGGVTTDSSGNVYVTGFADGVSASRALLIVKYNSSGVVQWQRTLNGTGSQGGFGIATDSAGNVYVVGENQNDSTGIIAKYNSSGTIQWQRSLAYTSKSVILYGASVVGAALYVAGYLNGTTDDAVTAKLPTGGALTGTYGSYTYASTSLTDAASSYTEATTTFTDAAGTLTDASAALTESTPTYTSTTTSI